MTSGVRDWSGIQKGRKSFFSFIYTLSLANSWAGYRHRKWEFDDIGAFFEGDFRPLSQLIVFLFLMQMCSLDSMLICGVMIDTPVPDLSPYGAMQVVTLPPASPLLLRAGHSSYLLITGINHMFLLHKLAHWCWCFSAESLNGMDEISRCGNSRKIP